MAKENSESDKVEEAKISRSEDAAGNNCNKTRENRDGWRLVGWLRRHFVWPGVGYEDLTAARARLSGFISLARFSARRETFRAAAPDVPENVLRPRRGKLRDVPDARKYARAFRHCTRIRLARRLPRNFQSEDKRKEIVIAASRTFMEIPTFQSIRTCKCKIQYIPWHSNPSIVYLTIHAIEFTCIVHAISNIGIWYESFYTL